MSIEKRPALSERHVQNCSLIHPSHSEKTLFRTCLKSISPEHLSSSLTFISTTGRTMLLFLSRKLLFSNPMLLWQVTVFLDMTTSCNSHLRSGRGEEGEDFSEIFLRIFTSLCEKWPRGRLSFCPSSHNQQVVGQLGMNSE